ncbi:hypothetical protein AJ79_00882 [Helicocarpus griseus UAMH5409]|uniref:Uncharacterized protein n=1 Tax=Helicocarpus griseus UAMH5409 TaxID=1447875 RepID=A0A2B7Y9K1_9EURO|nr:hypothetical protein AJ79_00882 [Helicocarpus griseus UAMH5409]
MDGPPPPPPPHGSPPGGGPPPNANGGYRKSTDLPDGPYDIFIVPPHSAGSGFIYLPSLQCHRNSFLAGVAATLLAVALYIWVLPIVKAWVATVAQSGGLGVFMLVIGVGVASWAWGRAQTESSGTPPPPPPRGTKPPPGGGAGPRSPPHEPPPSSGPNHNPGGGAHYQNFNGSYPGAGFGNGPNPSGQYNGGPFPGGQYPGGHQYAQGAGTQQTPGGNGPPPSPKSPPDPPPQPPPKPAEAPKPETKDQDWEKAREETRRKEDIRRKMEEFRKKREEEEKEKQKQREKEAREREYRERKEKREKEREQERLAKEAAEKEAAEKAAKEKARAEAAARFAAAREAAAAKRAADKAAAEKLAAEKLAEKLTAEKLAAEKLASEKLAAEKRAESVKQAEARKQANSAKSPPRTPSPQKKPPPSATAKTELEDDAYSFRPYDRPKKQPSAPSVFSESSYAPSQSTARTTPPPSRRGPYTTKDPDKIIIAGVYMFNNTFTRTPVGQLVSGKGHVTDGLILRITTEGMFVDDDIRGVAQREWDVKAWTMKLVEVWCPQLGANPASRQSPTKTNPFRFSTSSYAHKVPSSEESDAYLANLLRSCKNQCRLGAASSGIGRNGSIIDGDLLQSAEFRGFHVVRASIRDQEGKKYVFIMHETEAWKVAIGLQRLRKGSQVRALGVCGLAANETNAVLESLGYTSN